MSAHAWPVCGHTRAISLLSGEIRDRSVRHAYVITGQNSVGKRTLASCFASSLVCPGAADAGIACGECDDCRRADRGIHPDIQHFSLESQGLQAKERTSSDHLTIDTVREVASVSAYRAYSSNYRVIILDDAQSLTQIAQEALLKTLEEPPPQLVLVLLADQAESLLPTIRSRCEHIALAPVPVAEIAGCLLDAGHSPETAQQLAVLSRGLPGWAFRAANEPELRDEREQTQHRVHAWVAADPFARVVRAFELAGDFAKSREAVFAELDAVAHYWRAVMMNAAGASAESETSVRMPNGTSGVLESSLRALIAVIECVSDLNRNVRPRLALEAMVMQWPPSSQGTE
ncbi:MAG: ATP-binding protein [Thermomicrobiales bacterium]